MNLHHNSLRSLRHSAQLFSCMARLLYHSQAAGRKPCIANHPAPSPNRAISNRYRYDLLELSVNSRKQTTAPHSNRYFFGIFTSCPRTCSRPAPIANPNCRPPLRSSWQTDESAAPCTPRAAPSRRAKFPGKSRSSRRMPWQTAAKTAAR